MDDLRRNGSGYIDQTAYKAIKNIEGVKEMERGEIWEVTYKDGTELAVVLSVKGDMCNVIILKEHATRMEDISINAKGLRFANPYVISNKHNKQFISFVSKMKDDKFSEIMRGVMDALNVCEFCNQEAPDSIDYQWECKQLELQLQEAQAEIRQLKEGKDEQEKGLQADDIRRIHDIATMKAERDLYKQMYEKLLDKLVER